MLMKFNVVTYLTLRDDPSSWDAWHVTGDAGLISSACRTQDEACLLHHQSAVRDAKHLMVGPYHSADRLQLSLPSGCRLTFEVWTRTPRTLRLTLRTLDIGTPVNQG